MYLCTTLYFIMKYIKNTAKTQVINRQFTSPMENNFGKKRSCCLGKIEKSFSPKLPDYFIQGVKKIIGAKSVQLYC